MRKFQNSGGSSTSFLAPQSKVLRILEGFGKSFNVFLEQKISQKFLNDS